MQSYELIKGPLVDASVWQGGVLWALALYVPLSAPLNRLESRLEGSRLPEYLRQPTLVATSLLLALAFGVITQIGFSWALGPSWASSLSVVAVGWSALLVLANSNRSDD